MVWGNSLRYHQWIEFFADGRKGYAEPEAIIEFSNCVVLLECKLTGGPLGRAQMEWLYKPLLEHIFEKPVRCCLVCKNVTAETPGPFFGSFEEFLLANVEFGTWHALVV